MMSSPTDGLGGLAAATRPAFIENSPAPAVPPGAGTPPTREAETAPARARRVGRIAGWTLAAGLAAFIAWAALAPLDEGVPAPGSVALTTKRKTVQHMSGGLVREVLVREGQPVVQGQPLLRLDDALARANYEAVRQHYLGLRAMEGRLLAEQAGAGAIRFHPDVMAAAGDPQVAGQIAAQEQLLAARRATLEADLAGIAETIEARKGALVSYRSIMESRRSQLALLNEELGQTRGLVQEGYAPRNRQLELERMVADARSAIADLEGNIVQATRAIAEQTQRAQQRRSQFRQETAAQLAETLREVNAQQEKFKAAREELARMEIRSPATGQVMGLQVQTVGGVIQAAQPLMDVVPEGEGLLLEARVPPHLIDRIRPGLPVDARFSSFAHAPQLVVDAKVLTVSHDLLNDPETRTSYYLARMEVTPEGLKALGGRQLQPGMPAELVFRTGERSLITYVLHPLVKRMAASMKEE